MQYRSRVKTRLDPFTFDPQNLLHNQTASDRYTGEPAGQLGIICKEAKLEKVLYVWS